MTERSILKELKAQLEERLIRLNQFPDVPAIAEHGIPEIKWVLNFVERNLK